MDDIRLRTPLRNTYMLLRHGKSEGNALNAYQGRMDSPLHEDGIAQAKSVVLAVNPDIVIHSPLARARDTAIYAVESVGAYELIEDERLTEKSGGEVEGLAYEVIAERHPDVWSIWETHEHEHILHSRLPGGESDYDVAFRLLSLILDLEANHNGKHILLVTHSGVIQAARYLAGHAKDDVYLKPIPNCHLEAFEII